MNQNNLCLISKSLFSDGMVISQCAYDSTKVKKIFIDFMHMHLLRIIISRYTLSRGNRWRTLFSDGTWTYHSVRIITQRSRQIYIDFIHMHLLHIITSHNNSSHGNRS